MCSTTKYNIDKMRRPLARRSHRGPVGVKRLKATRKPMSSRVFGSPLLRAVDGKPRHSRTGRMTPLLKKLSTEVGEMRDQGNTLTKQMWLLYNSFEEFIKVKHTERAGKPKSKSRKDVDETHEWLKKSGITLTKRVEEEEEGPENLEYKTCVPEAEVALCVGVDVASVTDMDPVIMSDIEETAFGGAMVPKRSPEKRTKDRLSLGDAGHRNSKKARRSSAKKTAKDIVVDKASAPDRAGEADKSVELFPWPLSHEHKRVLEASGRSVVRDSIHQSPASSEGANFSGDSIALSEHEYDASLTDSVPRLKVASPVTLPIGYGTMIKEEEIDVILYGSKKQSKRTPPKLPAKTTPKVQVENKENPIYENVDFVGGCKRASVSESHACPVIDAPQTTGSAETTAHSVGNDFSRESTSLDNKGLNMVKLRVATAGTLFPDPRSPINLVSEVRSYSNLSSPRLQRSVSAEDISLDKQDTDLFNSSPIYENVPKSLWGQVSPPRKFTMNLKTGCPTFTIPKPQPKHSSTPFRINFDKLDIQNITSQPIHSAFKALELETTVDLDLTVTPRKSAFRPYIRDIEKPVFTDCLLTQNVSPSYLCMSRRQRRQATKAVSKKLFSSPAPARSLDLTETGYASSKMVRRFKTIEQDIIYDQAPPSVDSGRGGSISPPTDDNSNGPIKMNDTIEHTIDLTTVTQPDGEPIYESIPDSAVYARVEDLTPHLSLSLADNTYDRIEDISNSTLVVSPDPPKLPPARVYTDNTLARNGGRNDGHPNKDRILVEGVKEVLCSKTPNATFTSKIAQKLPVKPDQHIKKSDIIDKDKFHVYTVGDVLESVERLAGHIQEPKARGNIYSLISDRQARRQISKCLAADKPVSNGPVKADHCHQPASKHSVTVNRPFDRWTADCNKENQHGGMPINRLPRYASIRKTTSFTDLSPNVNTKVTKSTNSLSRVGNTGSSKKTDQQKCPSKQQRTVSACVKTKVLTNTSHGYQNLQQFSRGPRSQASRPKSEALDSEPLTTFRRTRSALTLRWKNGALNEIWC